MMFSCLAIIDPCHVTRAGAIGIGLNILLNNRYHVH